MSYFEKHPNEWINGGDIELKATEYKYKGSTAGRELRWLSEHGFLHKKEIKNEKTGVESIWYSLNLWM